MRFSPIATALLVLGTSAHAQGVLPCGDVQTLQYTLRWELPEGPAATSYVLLRLPVGGQGESLELPAPAPGADGRYEATVPGFQNDTDYTVALVARNPEGDSASSEPLTVPAVIRGQCPAGPPAQPRLLEIVDQLGNLVQQLREALQP